MFRSTEHKKAKTHSRSKSRAIKSQIFTGKVKHHRHQTTDHSFTYPLFMISSHVDELDDICHRNPFWSHNKRNIASFNDDDYLPSYSGSMRERIDQLLKDRGYQLDHKDNNIFILTNWRYFGYLINPITCFYYFNQENELIFLVLEVTNTPWGKRINYVLPCDPKTKIQRLNFAKEMHVSPFYEMDMTYQLNCYRDDNKISLHISNKQKGEKVFEATLNLKSHSIDQKSLYKVLAKYPFMTLKVALSIYWQALKLWLKGVKYISPPKPENINPTDGPY